LRNHKQTSFSSSREISNLNSITLSPSSPLYDLLANSTIDFSPNLNGSPSNYYLDQDEMHNPSVLRNHKQTSFSSPKKSNLNLDMVSTSLSISPSCNDSHVTDTTNFSENLNVSEEHDLSVLRRPEQTYYASILSPNRNSATDSSLSIHSEMNHSSSLERLQLTTNDFSHTEHKESDNSPSTLSSNQLQLIRNNPHNNSNKQIFMIFLKVFENSVMLRDNELILIKSSDETENYLKFFQETQEFILRRLRESQRGPNEIVILTENVTLCLYQIDGVEIIDAKNLYTSKPNGLYFCGESPVKGRSKFRYFIRPFYFGTQKIENVNWYIGDKLISEQSDLPIEIISNERFRRRFAKTKYLNESIHRRSPRKPKKQTQTQKH
jgi:hypothetical protein